VRVREDSVDFDVEEEGHGGWMLACPLVGRVRRCEREVGSE